jgi:hypothetical protein
VSRTHNILAPAFQDLSDCLSDFRSANFEGANALLSRLVFHFDEEPLRGLLAVSQRPVDFGKWWAATSVTIGGMVGSGVLRWPNDRAERVALQVELCRRLANGEIKFLDFCHEFTNPHPSKNLTDHARKFCSVVLEPMVRDVMRLPEERPLPPILFETMGGLPKTGDHVLDELIFEACRAFRESAPSAARVSVEKLWDAWERLKTVRIPSDKRASISAILDTAAGGSELRSVLEEEATALTRLGNTFRIRHSEVGKYELPMPEHYEYLFHRLYAVMHLLLHAEYRRSGV